VEVVEMTASERTLAGRLSSPDHVDEYRLRFPLGLGEAACVAIACERGYTLVTDDNAGLDVYSRLRPGGPYQRIRGLLQRAANENLISEVEANDIHAEMTTLGFWDRTRPFPAPK
jgi:predicted nucleic acid-binding protein